MIKTSIASRGFTLIELSIVLVIIGLIIGGVLVGQDLIGAAGVRATISQIEQYNTAANTFRNKFGYLPGDIKDPDATSFGLIARGTGAGRGDGDGLLYGSTGSGPAGNVEENGETAVFWVDLSTTRLIDGTFATATMTPAYSSITGSGLASYFPPARLGKNNYIYAYAGGSWNGSAWIPDGYNYFGMSNITKLQVTIYSTPELTVTEAYQIDKKMDDGLPQSGNVTATYLNYALASSNIAWAAGGGVEGAYNSTGHVPTTAATAGSVTTCYDNGNSSGVVQHYSVEIGNGGNVNCALSFKFQ